MALTNEIGVKEFDRKFKNLQPGDMFIKKSNEKNSMKLPLIMLEYDTNTDMCIVAKYYACLPAVDIMPVYILITEFTKVSNKEFQNQIRTNLKFVNEETLMKDEDFMCMRIRYMNAAYGEKNFGDDEQYMHFVEMYEKCKKIAAGEMV